MNKTEPTMSVSKIVNLMKSLQHIIYGKGIRIICESTFGKNILFGQMDILPVV